MDYRKRRELLFESCQVDAIVIPANRQMQFSLDQAYGFEQERNFYYLSGINAPGGFLVIANNEHLYLAPSRSKIEELFDDHDNLDQLKAANLDKVVPAVHSINTLKALLGGKTVGVLDFKLHSSVSMIKNPTYALAIRKVKRSGAKKTVNIAEQIIRLRQIKDKDEIEMIDRAAQLTLSTLEQLEENIGSFTSEHQVEGFITEKFRINNARHSYPPIVSSGKNSMVIHYIENSAKLAESSLLIDVGAKLEGYNSDISRTYNLLSDQLIDQTIQAVTDIQQQVINMVKPGVMFKDLHLKAFQLTRDASKRLGLTDGSKEQTAKLFPYSVGHFLGLDVHDVGVYKEPLQENMVITVEPGMHSSEHGFGVRVEDDVLITENGAKILGKNHV